MGRTLGVLSVLLCLFCGAEAVSAQDARNSQANGFQLGRSYPNPFNPETTIPFTLGEEIFADGRPVRVSMRIYNILAQLVAHPVALGHSSGEGIVVDQLEYYQPGEYEAFWDGTDQMGRQVASGIYLMQLSVNGLKPLSQKLYVLK